MRIKGSEHKESQGFWPSTRQWLGSRRGLLQFLLAVCVGLVLALALGLFFRLYAWQRIEPVILDLRAAREVPAQTTLEPTQRPEDLPNLYFDIGFEEFQTMAAQRDEALQTGVLVLDDDDWLRADIRYQDQTIPIRVRLKGDWLDHLGDDKWSFKVKTRNDTALMGMRSFSVQSPHTRKFLDEWLFLEDLRRADILAPRYSFVNVFVNGEDWGVYALEESFSKELLESLGRREGIILRLDENLIWERRALYTALGYDLDPFAMSLDWPEYAQVDEFNTNRVVSDPVLAEQREAAFGLLRGFQEETLSPSEAFDAEVMGRYLAHSHLFGADHNLIWHNERFYYNPLTSKLEPIGYDAMPVIRSHARIPNLARYDDLAIVGSYAREIMRVSQPGYLEQLQAEYDTEFAQYQAALVEEFDPKQVQPPWEDLANRQTLLMTALNPNWTVYAYVSNDDSGSTTDVHIGNILRYPVTLQEVIIGGQAVPIQPEWVQDTQSPALHQDAAPAVVLRTAADEGPEFVTLQIPNSVIQELVPADSTLFSSTLQIATSLYGMDNRIVVDAQWDYPPVAETPFLPVQPTITEALERYPFLAQSEQPGFLDLKSGTWQVDGDLVLPAGIGLRATGAATLAFDQDAILFSDSPLVLQGPTPGSISLLPKDESWAGLIVLKAGADRPSLLHNVEIRATSGISRNGWITTGGVTFYESPVELSGARLLDSVAEDAINIVRTEFEFHDTEFGNIASDAFDGDFVEGRIQHSSFHDVRGDAIDLSGSDVIVDDVNLLRIHDKGISAGESSTVMATGVHASNVGIAAASKDLSYINIQGGTIDRAWVAALAAYIKKEEYGPASIRTDGLHFADDSRPALVQAHSRVSIDGNSAPVTDFDVPGLYTLLEALGQMQFLDYEIEPGGRLAGVALEPPDPTLDGSLRIYLYWQAGTRPKSGYTMSVQFMDDTGAVVAHQDGVARDEAFGTTLWKPGEEIDELYTVPLPPDLPGGEYQVVIGLDNLKTGERLPVRSPSGEAIPNGAIVLDQTFVIGD